MHIPIQIFRFKDYIDFVKQRNMTLQWVQASYAIIINEICMMTTNDLVFIYNQMKCATSKGKSLFWAKFMLCVGEIFQLY